MLHSKKEKKLLFKNIKIVTQKILAGILIVSNVRIKTPIYTHIPVFHAYIYIYIYIIYIYIYIYIYIFNVFLLVYDIVLTSKIYYIYIYIYIYIYYIYIYIYMNPVDTVVY